MATTLLGMIGASSRTSARGSWRPVSRKAPIGCPSISAIVASAPSPTTTPNAGSPPAENLAMRTGRRPSIRPPFHPTGRHPQAIAHRAVPFPAGQGHSRPVRVVATGLRPCGSMGSTNQNHPVEGAPMSEESYGIEAPEPKPIDEENALKLGHLVEAVSYTHLRA